MSGIFDFRFLIFDLQDISRKDAKLAKELLGSRDAACEMSATLLKSNYVSRRDAEGTEVFLMAAGQPFLSITSFASSRDKSASTLVERARFNNLSAPSASPREIPLPTNRANETTSSRHKK